MKDVATAVENGDKFALLADKFWFKLSVEPKEPEETAPANDQPEQSEASEWSWIVHDTKLPPWMASVSKHEDTFAPNVNSTTINDVGHDDITRNPTIDITGEEGFDQVEEPKQTNERKRDFEEEEQEESLKKVKTEVDDGVGEDIADPPAAQGTCLPNVDTKNVVRRERCWYGAACYR